MSKQTKALVAGGLVAVTGYANAAIDVTAVTSAVTDIAAVGTAVFAVYIAVKLTKWVRRAL